MCGIFAYYGPKNNAGEIILEGLKSLEYRGYDSWGIALKKSDGELILEKQVGKIEGANIPPTDSHLGIGHTRWATHGGVTIANAHPHVDCSKKIAIIHNGIVENYLEIKKNLQSSHTFISETDTEVIVHLIEEYIQNGESPKNATQHAFMALQGRNAIIVMFTDSEELVLAKTGSPIIIGAGFNEHFVASDAAALLPHTRNVIFLKDNELAHISKQNVEIFNLTNDQPVPLKIEKLTWELEASEKGPYPHFLLKEIMDQGHTIADAASQNETLIKDFADLIKSSFGTYLIGCGTAAHACRTAQYIFSIIAKKHVNFCIGSEFSYFESFLKPESLVIAASQSGETADILEAVEAARKHKSSVAALVNVVGSTLERSADKVIPLRSGPEKAVLSSKAFTSKLSIFYLIAYTLNNEYKNGLTALREVSKKADAYLKNNANHEQLKKLANKIYTSNDIYLLGRGIHFPIALEAAHKIKEASYIHAEGFAGGEPKHCEISLVEKGTPTIVFVPEDETRDAIVGNAIEFKTRGAYIIGVSPVKHEVFDEWIEVEDDGVFSAILNIIPMQLLAYYLALEKGIDPDKPRNLAKSVTVK